eukprot:scaffold148002_cov38-Cyclotella_meneghiniana.AAC.1
MLVVVVAVAVVVKRHQRDNVITICRGRGGGAIVPSAEQLRRWWRGRGRGRERRQLIWCHDSRVLSSPVGLGRWGAPPYTTISAPVISALLSQCCELLRPV